MIPDARRLYRAIEATWPPAKAVEAGPWILREGGGGGKRVSAATQRAAFDPVIDLPAAEDAMRILGQDPLFMIRDGDRRLDIALEMRSYRVVDPVNVYLARVRDLTTEPLPRVTAFTVWEPLAVMRELWAEAGIGPARLRIMERVRGPRTAVLGRMKDKPAGVAFCAVDGEVAMLHALEVRPDFRRLGLGAVMTRAAAHWAADWGAEWLALLCTRDNGPANALYSGLGMRAVARYHYRIRPAEEM